MNNKELCKKCIYYDDFCCRNNKAICVNNSEYRDTEMVINAIINQKDGTRNPTDEETNIYNNRLETEAKTIDEISLL